MNPIAAVDMDEVTRLTRAGRLVDATALLQAGLGFHRSPTPGPDDEPRAAIRRLHPDAFDHPAPKRIATRFRPLSQARRAGRDKNHTLDLGRPLQAPLAEPSLPRAPGSSFEMSTITNAAGALSYKLYIPANRGDVPAPLVVMLHGCTQSPDDFAAGTRMNELAEQHGFFVAYPAQAKSANASRCWNWFRARDQRRDQGEPSLIADATRQILADHRIDARRVFVAGLSAGGAAAAVMGCTYPDLYAGVGVHSGLACGAASDLPSALQAMQRGAGGKPRPASSVPTIVFHGDADRTVGPSNAGEVADQAHIGSGLATTERGMTAAGTRYVRTVRRDTDGRAVSEKWMVEGGGHAWFGGSRDGSYTEPRGPDASREILRFFGII